MILYIRDMLYFASSILLLKNCPKFRALVISPFSGRSHKQPFNQFATYKLLSLGTGEWRFRDHRCINWGGADSVLWFMSHLYIDSTPSNYWLCTPLLLADWPGCLPVLVHLCSWHASAILYSPIGHPVSVTCGRLPSSLVNGGDLWKSGKRMNEDERETHTQCGWLRIWTMHLLSDPRPPTSTTASLSVQTKVKFHYLKSPLFGRSRTSSQR